MAEQGKVPIKLWTDPLEIEPEALTQLRNAAALPFVFHHVAAMPDVHLGIGATVGSVIATKGAICPAAVGVDIGCGMMAKRTLLKKEDLGDLSRLRKRIEGAIPVGFSDHSTPLPRASAWLESLGTAPFVASQNELKKSAHQLGTLGGGNHFIEISLDEQDQVWVVLHSGSRAIGNKTAQKHIESAKGDMKKLFIKLPDPDLAYFVQDTQEFDRYMSDLLWCQDYAAKNRALMLERVLSVLPAGKSGLVIDPEEKAINCHHNYVALENHFGSNVLVTRKGAIRARSGDLGIIPGSMGTETYIVEGRGNPDSYSSAPHGAGRAMSRTAAKKKFSVQDLVDQTDGVECRKDAAILDEIPGAYKPIGMVMDAASDLVEVKHKLKQVVNVKG